MRARLRRLGLTWRTARHLRPSQIVARASFLAERRLLAVRPGILERRLARLAEEAARGLADAAPLWPWPPGVFDPAARADPEAAERALRGELRFLNETRRLQSGPGAPFDWRAADASRLWRFTLHGFGFAVDLAAEARRGREAAYHCLRWLVLDWLRNHPASAADPWHPFVVSERLIAWLIARDLLRDGGALDADDAFAEILRQTVMRHACFLEQHLETDVGGNHLLKNAVALLLAGCAFEGPAAVRWRALASRVLTAELSRQVLVDGGHYERSPMYHLLVLADVLIAAAAAERRGLPSARVLRATATRMQRYAAWLVHSDGEIPLFNDAVLGQAPAPGALTVRAPTAPSAAMGFPASGYFCLPCAGPAESGLLIADCGPPGPDDLPAHVHADALSFELSVGARRVLVDGGMHGYDAGPRRDLLRGTASHNTVTVAGRDQSEVWGAFRVGRRARVTLEHWEPRATGGTLIGSHDGYEHGPGPGGGGGVRHERRFDAVPGSGWRVVDTLYGTVTRPDAVARYRLHPGFQWRSGPDGAFDAVDSGGVAHLTVRPFGADDAYLEDGLYAERFGQALGVQVLCLAVTRPTPAVWGAWLLLPGGAPAVV